MLISHETLTIETIQTRLTADPDIALVILHQGSNARMRQALLRTYSFKLAGLRNNNLNKAQHNAHDRQF